MAASPRVQWQDVQQSLGGQPLKEVTFAQHVVLVGANQGGVINIAPPGQQAADRIQPRRDRPHILPRSAPGFLDREQEQGVMSRALARGQVVDLNGPDGMGKTALIGRMMQTQLPDADAFRDGMVYLSARHEVTEDLLQDLFACFFESDGDVKVTENDVRRYMAGKRALVVVDDANHLEAGEAENLAQVVPQCPLLVAGRQQQVWQGTTIALEGLPPDEAVALFERHYGTASAQDRPAVMQICASLEGVPLAIIKVATIAAKRRLPLPQVLRQIQAQPRARDPLGQAFWTAASRLSEGEQRLLGALAAPGGATVGAEALPIISGLPPDKIDQYLSRLQSLGLVHANSPRYGLDDGFRPHARQAWADDEMRARAANYYLRRAGTLRGPGEHPDEENVMAALGHFQRHQAWRQVVTIARAVEPYLATTGRWGQWRRRLNQAWQAARKLGDRATEAWAQNQLGIIALAAGDTAAAQGLFEGALSLWRALGDEVGITITRWNLQVLLGPPPPPPGRGEPGPRTGGSRLIAPLAVASVAVVVVLIGLVVGILLRRDQATPTAFPPPTTEVLPEATLELWLEAGCGRSYPSGEMLPIRIRSTVDGVVELFWTGPRGDRQLLFSEPVSAGQIASRDWDVPQEEGEWLLEADLNGGQARGQCAFSVVDRTPPPTPTITLTPTTLVPPGIQIWLANGCGEEYEAGSLTWIYFQADVDGLVVIWLDGQQQILQTEVEGGQTYESSWYVVEQPGGHDLRANLHVGRQQAEGVCWFSVAIPVPVDDQGPVIGTPTVSPESPSYYDEVFIGAYITDAASGMAAATLWYWEDGWTSADMTKHWLDETFWVASAGWLPEGRSWYYIEAWDGAGNQSESDRFPLDVGFVTESPPPAPTPLEPGNEAVFVSLTSCPIVLRWTAVSHPGGIAQYQVNLQECEPDQDPCWDFRSISTTETSYDISHELSFNFYFRWNVRAIDYDGQSSESSAWLYYKSGACPP